MKKKLLSIVYASAIVITAGAQAMDKGKIQAAPEQTMKVRNCGTMEHLEMLKQQDPTLEVRMQQNEAWTQNWIENNYNPSQRVVYTIPVVFHVVYQNATENISNQRLLDQLQVLNDDYRKLNTDASNVPAAWQNIAADCEVNFCLATQDPQGNPTTGITRTSTTVSTFNTNDAVKYTAQGGKDAWDRTKYLNIWVCDLGTSLLGYAQFPGGPAATDGVVLNYRYTGTTGSQAPFNLGRTATHEVGHWLNLYHIWGDDGSACSGSDQVSDTPNQAGASSGCFTVGQVRTDACTGSAPGIMWQNYMDYTDDACMYMFTAGQKARIQACLAGTRNSLASSPGCNPTSSVPNDAGISAVVSPSGTLCTQTFTPVVTLKNFGSATLTSVTVNYKIDNNPVQTFSWTGSLTSGNTTNVTLASMNTTIGTHTFTAYTSNPNGNSDGQSTNDQSQVTFTVMAAGQNLPYSQGFENTTFPPTGCTINNPDASTTWTRATNAASSGSASMYIDNFNYNAAGEIDEFVLPNLNLSSVTNPVMTFQVAYRLYTNPTANPNFSDSLRVLVSTDCGATWTSVYFKYGTQLTTATPAYSTTAFVPTASQWRLETVSLASYASQTNVMIKFVNSTHYENNLFIDDINITTSTGVNNIDLSGSVNVFPNPNNGLFNLNVSLPAQDRMQVRVYNTIGQTVQTFEEGNTYGGSYNIDLTQQAEGVYFVEVRTGEGVTTKRVVVSR
ncbi:MAG: hypothetical protein Fur0041_21410 [Bacteroidia bacterium]